MSNNGAMMRCELPGIEPISRGKVRDIFDLGDKLLVVTTDRISAFDVVMKTPIPGKGKVLTQMSIFWFREIIRRNHHLISCDPEDLPPKFRVFADQLRGRMMIVKKADVFPIECIVRGYLVGSGWEDYQRTGMVCGIPLPPGLKEAQKLPEPIFTPSTKALLGQHDENIPFEKMREIVGPAAKRLKRDSLEIYKTASDFAESRGIILADTKFEFGMYGGLIIHVDEVLTPDSSRFWPADRYRVGCSPESFDKQFLRDYLKASGWKKTDPSPELPKEIVMNTQSRYLQALTQLTGKGLE